MDYIYQVHGKRCWSLGLLCNCPVTLRASLGGPNGGDHELSCP